MPCGQPRDRSATLNSCRVSYELHRSPRRRKSISLRVEAGHLRVLAPARTPLAQIDDLIQQRAEWIAQRLEAPPPSRLRDQLKPGGSLPLLGEPIPVVDGPHPFLFHDDPFSGFGPHFSVNPYADGIAEAAEAWLRRYARTEIVDRVESWSEQVDAYPARIQIRDQKTRWGSASTRGTLSFNWRLIFAPPEILDYVVVHELCHLIQPDHSSKYWALVESVMPDAQHHRRQLRDISDTLIW